jgi:protein Mpv17
MNLSHYTTISLTIFLILVINESNHEVFAFSPTTFAISRTKRHLHTRTINHRHHTVRALQPFQSTKVIHHKSHTPNLTKLHVIELNYDFNPVMSIIDNFYKEFPYESAFLTCSLKASAADFVAQNKERIQNLSTSIQSEMATNPTSTSTCAVDASSNPCSSIHISRNLAFILYGGFYQGIAQQYIYTYLFPLLFGRNSDMFTVCSQVFFDLSVITLLLCLPAAYLTKALIHGKSLGEGWDKYIHDMRYNHLAEKYYAIWIPANFVIFGIIPEHLRILCIASVSFIWMIILSEVSSKETYFSGLAHHDHDGS